MAQKHNYKGLKVIRAWDEGNVINLVCKINGKRGVKKITDFEWYFAIKADALKKGVVQGIIDKYYEYGIVTKIEDTGEFAKIYANKYHIFVDVENKTGIKRKIDDLFKELKHQGVALFESDLSLWKRFCVDNFIEVEGDLDILYFDIETDDSHNGIVIGRDQILSWAATNNKGQVWFECEDDEKTLLMKLLEVIHTHDVICGWNSNNFDVPYIQERLKVHGIEYDWRKKIHLDLLPRCARIYSYNMFNIGLTGFALNEVARVFLGDKKVEHKESIKELFDTNRELLKTYNIKDVTLLRDLDSKLLITDLMIKECQWTGAFLDRFFIGELLDSYILRRTRELGFFQYSRPDRIEKLNAERTDIRGGYVMSPKVGFYDNVRVCDFKSLYPSIIVGFNIGRDSLNRDLSDEGFIAMCDFLKLGTKDARKIEDVEFHEWKTFLESEKLRLDPRNENIQAANNTYFRRDKISFIGELVQNFLDKRAEWKAQAKGLSKESPEYISIQQSQGMVKEMANSMYGITGDKSSRYFDKHVAEAITLTGQFMNRISSHFAEKRGYTTIYGDTDSIFLPVEEDAAMDKLIDDVNSDLKEYLDNVIGVNKNIVLLQYEKTFSKLIMLDKKRYTGRMVMYDGNPTDKLFTRGLENVKNNTIKLARAAIVDLIEKIVKHDVDVETVVEWLEALKLHVMTDDIPVSELIIMTRISKSPDKYATKQAHVRLAERLIAAGKMLPIDENAKGWGTRMYYFINVDTTTEKQEAFIEEEWTGAWDRKYYWDIQVYAPIRRILETVWPGVEWGVYSIEESEKRQRQLDREIKKQEKEAELARKKAEREAKKAARDVEVQKKLEARAARKKKIEQERKEVLQKQLKLL